MRESDEYTCAMCGETYLKGQSDAAAIAELETVFGITDIEDCSLVCEDCYKELGLTDKARINDNDSTA